MGRRSFAALLVPVLLLAACAGGAAGTPAPSPGPGPSPVPAPQPPSREPVTITFACRGYEQGDFTRLAESFEQANPGIHVQLVLTGENDWTVEPLAVKADTFLHASLAPEDWSFLLDLTPFVDESSFPSDDFFPGALDHFRWQGRLYGLPARLSLVLVFYDREMFDQAGLPYPRAGWSWDDLISTAARLTERQGGQVTRYGFVDPYSSYTLLSMLQSQGVALWNEQSDPPQPLFDTPEVARVVRQYTGMALDSQVMPVPKGDSIQQVAANLVKEREVAMWIDTSHDRGYHAQRIHLGLAPLPEGIQAGSPRQIEGFFISAGTAHPEAAWRWLSYLSANYQPSFPDFLPGRRSVIEQLPWWVQLDPETRAVYEYALAHPTTNDTPLNSPLGAALFDIFERGATVEEALSEVQKWALEEQASLANVALPTPRPVATPRPEPPAGQRVIKFAPVNSEDMDLYRQLAVSFMQSHPGLTVDIAPVSVYTPKEIAESTDCFGLIGPPSLYGPDQLASLRALGPLVDADSAFDLSDYYPQFLEPLQQEGELWGLPYEADALMVYTNLDRFAAAGVTPPRPNWTMQEFLNDAVALSAGGQYGFTTYEGVYGNLIFVLERLGARLYDDTQDPPAPTLDDPAVVVALGQYAALWRSHPLSPETPSRETGWPDVWMMGLHPAGVKTGQVAMWVDTIEHFQAAGSDLPFSVGISPLPVGSTSGTEYRIRAYYISAQASDLQACWQWLVFLSGQPAIVRTLPVRRSMAASAMWQGFADEAVPAYLATLDYPNAPIFYPRSTMPWLAYSYPWLDGAFQSTVDGQDPAVALTAAQEKAEKLIGCLKAGGNMEDRQQALVCARQVDPEYPLSSANP
jgi:multiple sugar transport system substrate-binding protein